MTRFQRHRRQAIMGLCSILSLSALLGGAIVHDYGGGVVLGASLWTGCVVFMFAALGCLIHGSEV